MLFLGLFLLGLLSFLVYILQSDETLAMKMVVESALLLMSLMVAIGLRLAGAETFKRAVLVVRNDGIEIRHPSVFRHPLMIPRADIQAISLSRHAGEGFWGSIEGQSGGTLERRSRELVPMVEKDDLIVPNVMVALTKPISLEPVRRRSLFTSARANKSVLAADNTWGLSLAVRNIEVLQQALSGWGVMRKLGQQDRHLLEPQPEDHRRFRRVRWIGYLGLAHAVLYVADLIWEGITN
jgi:hypothetical protein